MEKGFNRKLYNTAIVEKLRELINKYPDLRFGQILINSDIIQFTKDDKGFPLAVKDPYFEEPEVTWERMKINSFVFKELFN